MEKKGSRDKIFFLGLLLLILIFLVVFTYVKDCGEDKKCFSDSFQSCKKAKVFTSSDNAVYSYEILGQSNNKCVTLVTLERVNTGIDSKIKQEIEGKKMVCEIPKSEIVNESIFNTKEASAYCTGPLREIFLQITVEKLYSFVVSSIAPSAVSESNITKAVGIPSSMLY